MSEDPALWRKMRMFYLALAACSALGIYGFGTSWDGVLCALVFGSSSMSVGYSTLVLNLLAQKAALWSALEDTRDMTKAFRQAVETWPAELADSDARPKTLN